MNKITQYLILNYSKVFLNTLLIFFSLGILLNLFEEIEFFKKLDVSFYLPIILSLANVPSIIIELLPFITFLSATYFFIKLRSSKELLLTKSFGFSNFKITIYLSFFILVAGFFIIFFITPITSPLVKFYESEKAKYSRDVDHLIAINKNGLWLRENTSNGKNLIYAKKIQNDILENLSIYVFDNNNKMIKRIDAETAAISSNPWQVRNANINDILNTTKQVYPTYSFASENTIDRILSLYKNLNTISFLNLIKNYSKLNKEGYNKNLLNEKINKFLSIPFFLFLMVVLSSIFTIGSNKILPNFYYVTLSILVCVIIYYLKDLSIVLGQTEKINLILSIWAPLIIISLFCSIGVIQINEK